MLKGYMPVCQNAERAQRKVGNPWHGSKIPLVLTTKVTHLRSLLFRQQDGVNCVVRSLCWGVSQNRAVQLVGYGR